MPSVPVVVVLGATGVGKSQLAVEIALKYKGEVISADSMQLYKNLDVTTNKVTEEEKAGIPHHMIDFLDPSEAFTVVDFRNRALPIVERLRKAGKIPVIVGGTNYYIESILWDTLINPDDHKDGVLASSIPLSSLSEESSETLHARLREIDPERADTIHPNDRRKVLRSLDIYEKKKQTHSEFLKKQAEAGGVLGGPLRYKDAVIFWIRSDQSVLDQRLDDRVDKMIERGLIKEMLDFHEKYNECREKPDYELGIFQSIGFKEFHEYLTHSVVYRESKTGKKEFRAGLSLMKQRTKKYSKYQAKWIRRRFLEAPSREVPPLYALDGTDLERWNENVRDVALEIMEDTLNHAESPRHKPLEAEKRQIDPKSHHVCECGTICLTESSWKAHKNSKQHLRNLKRLEYIKNPEKADRERSKRRRIKGDSEENESGNQSENDAKENEPGNDSEGNSKDDEPKDPESTGIDETPKESGVPTTCNR